MGLQVRAFKNSKKWTPAYKENWRWRNILNKCSSYNWKTKIEIPPSIYKVAAQVSRFLWSLAFLSWLSNYFSITICWLNRYLYIWKIVLEILGKLIYDFRSACGCLTLNEMRIKLASLTICLTNYNFTNTSSTPPTKLKVTVLFIVNLMILSTSNGTSIHWKIKDEIFNLF